MVRHKALKGEYHKRGHKAHLLTMPIFNVQLVLAKQFPISEPTFNPLRGWGQRLFSAGKAAAIHIQALRAFLN